MSEAKTEEKEVKKKSKLPIILMMMVVLGAGGFFGMKSRGGGEPKKPPVLLGKVVPLEEFLLNLKGRDTYLRVKLALHLRKDYDEKKLEEHMPAINDQVISCFSSKSIGTLSTEAGKQVAKVELATAINHTLERIEEQSEEHPKKKGHKEKGAEEKKEKDEPKEQSHADWQSQEGPVLKIYFTSFATQ